jgi:iron complex outermembrane recepter protein
MKYRNSFMSNLLATTIICGAAGIATPAFAQDSEQEAAPTSVAPTADQADTDEDGNTVTVTGTIFRRTTRETISPLTVLSADTLRERGINTTEEAINRLSANNGGSMPNAWNATGNFAQGASGVSLRGLTTNSTLLLFDGNRNAYYPLADDGTRNFVDLNTIPNGVIERIEVLRDGASSTYGADAIAGVVNVITRRQITGFHANLSAGTSEHGDSGEIRADFQAGIGDLEDQGFNFYVAGEYQQNDQLMARDRGRLYNTSDLSWLCGVSNGLNPALIGNPAVQRYPAGSTVCRTNSIANGIQFDGTYGGVGTTTVPVVRATGASTAFGTRDEFMTGQASIAGSRYELLNQAAGCQGLTSIQLTPAQLQTNAVTGNAGGTAAANGIVCQQDPRYEWGVISPEIQRFGVTARATARITDDIEAYAMFNYYQSKVFYTGAPNAYRVNSPAGGIGFSTANLALPVYVCPQVVGCTAVNGVLNPNNPYAALGQTARLIGRYDRPTENETLSRSYRAAAGVSGSFADVWQFNVDVSASRVDLQRTSRNYIYAQHLIDVIGNGSFNFVNMAANSEEIREYLTPENVNDSKSELFNAQANVSRPVAQLPGGPLMIGVGASARYEAVDNPSGNPVDDGNPYERYFVLNGTGFSGSRWVYSGYGEISAPILPELELSLSGRYDSYSSGQHAFSPRAGIKVTPIPQVAFRGSWSRGFRIPSFAEANGLPTTGYITLTPDADFAAAHGGNAYGTAAYSLGLTSIGTPGLRPERSRNITFGVVVQPLPWLSATVDYFDIKKTNVISGANYEPALEEYYANNGVCTTPGLTCIAGAPDPAFPNALPLLQFIQYGFENSAEQRSRGIDFSLEARIPLINGVRLITSVDATRLIELSQTFADGSHQRYDDTLGPYQITSASGSPRWRGTWQNTLDFGNARITATTYYTSGYGMEAEDAGGERHGVCEDNVGAPIASYRDSTTPVVCRTKAYISTDLSASIDVGEQFTFYVNILNVFGDNAPYDPTTYGGYNYNPAWAQSGVLGRYFRAGVRARF